MHISWMPSKRPAWWLITRGVRTNEKHMSISVRSRVVQARADCHMTDNDSEVDGTDLINFY